MQAEELTMAASTCKASTGVGADAFHSKAPSDLSTDTCGKSWFSCRATWLLASASQHAAFLSHSEECHECKANGSVTSSHSMVGMLDSSSDSRTEDEQQRGMGPHGGNPRRSRNQWRSRNIGGGSCMSVWDSAAQGGLGLGNALRPPTENSSSTLWLLLASTKGTLRRMSDRTAADLSLPFSLARDGQFCSNDSSCRMR